MLCSMYMLSSIKKIFSPRNSTQKPKVVVYSNRPGSAYRQPIDQQAIKKGAQFFVDRYESVISDLAKE